MNNETMYVCELSKEQQDKISNMLQNILENKEDIERAMNSRLCDLENTIDIYNL